MRETFEHTADLGLRVTGKDFAALCEQAAAGLFEIIAGDLAQIRPRTRRHLRVEGAQPEYVLVDWLNELLYAFESERMLFSRFEVRSAAGGIDADAWGEPLDPGRHTLAHEIKAITYHALSVGRTKDGWEARVIVDI